MTHDNERCKDHNPWVFLSSSYPSEDRDPKYVKGTDVRAISNAVVELVRAVFEAGGSLVFGGHPTISPLVLQIAESMAIPLGAGGTPRLRIYQSAVFRGRTPQASERLGKLAIGEQVETEGVNGESPVFRGDTLDPKSVRKSLELMRRRMFGDHQPVGAVFVGGMEGVEDEHRIATEFPLVRRYLVESPGGAVRLMAEGGEPVAPDDTAKDLVKGLRQSQLFPWLMRSIVTDMGL